MNLEYLHKPSEIQENKELLILLHGYGSNKEDLFSFADAIPKKYEIISLQAPRNTPYGGFCWYDINFMNAQKFNNTEQAKESIQLVVEDIKSWRKELNCNTISLCGFSQGAILSYAMSLHYPEKFKKILCLSGYPAKDIVGNIDKNLDFSRLEFYVSHGKEDAVIPIEWAREAESLLTKLSINYTYKEYYSGHGINPDNFKDLIEFLNS